MDQPAESGWVSMADGIALRTRTWRRRAGASPRGCVLIVHGIGEHSGRYADTAERLNAWGFDVIAFDQFGHGDSPGRRGTLTTPTRLLDDLATMVDHVREGVAASRALILLGHSMGGALVARFVAEGIRPVEGVVLSSPALASGMRPWQRVLARVLARIAPGLTIANGLPSGRISHDEAVVAAYRADPKVHDRVSGRLAQFVDAAGPAVLAAASRWSIPTLLLYAGDDYLVDADGSRRFAREVPSSVVVVREFPAHYHELFNERDRTPVFETLRSWLDARFP